MDQSVSGGNFMWVRHARAWCEKFEATEDQQLLSVSHDGYRRLSDPVIHSREFEFSRADGVLRIVDRLTQRDDIASNCSCTFPTPAMSRCGVTTQLSLREIPR